MNDSTRDWLQTLSRVLVRCWLIGFALLAISLAILLATRDTVHQLHGNWFGLTAHELDVIAYCGLGLFKLCVLSLFLIPWLAIKLVLWKGQA